MVGDEPGQLSDTVRHLLGRRVVLVSGLVDEAKASETCATLMALDALGDERIELRVNSADCSVDAAMVVMDVMDVVGVPIHTVALGIVKGGTVGLVAAGARRVMSPHSRLHLREPDTSVSGRASEIERALAAQSASRADFQAVLARLTGRTAPEIEAEWERGQFLDAADAVTLGYADEVVG